MSSVLIIGAGLSGLTAARTLVSSSIQVTVLDKGRGVGGRLATRRMEPGRADHGTQYLSAQTPDFQQQVGEWLTAGVIREWSFQTVSETDTSPKHPRYVGVQGMSGLAKILAEGLHVQLNERVIRLEPVGGRWHAHTESGHTYRADAVLCTLPAPQTLALLRDSDLDPAEIGVAALSAITYQPCITVVVALNQPNQLPAPGGFRFGEGPVAWLADNQQKGISSSPTLTIHASADFSRKRLEYTDADVNFLGAELISELGEWILPSSVDSFQVHRWRYSLADNRYAEPLLVAQTPAPLLFGGDGFGMGNVEGAFLSGRALAKWLSDRV